MHFIDADLRKGGGTTWQDCEMLQLSLPDANSTQQASMVNNDLEP